MIWTKGAHQSAKFQTFDCSRKISPNLYFDGLLKVYKILAKKYRGVTLKIDAKFEEKLICCLKNDKNSVKFDPSTRKSLKLALSFAPICKVFNVWPKKVGEWCKIWRGIDSSFQNWHEEFDEFWPKHLKVLKTFILMCSFWAKYILFELKKYRGVIFNETEEEYKIWRGIYLPFQNWHTEFDKFWPEQLKVSQFFTLMGSFWAKYNVWAKKVPRSYLSWHWRVIQSLKKNWIAVWKMTWGIGKFSPEYSEVSKLELWWDPFVESRKCMSLKFTEELCVMTMKNDAKFEEELTCHFKTDMRNLTNFDLNTRKSKKIAL